MTGGRPNVVLDSMRSVTKGRVYPLARALSATIPHLCDGDPSIGERFVLKMTEFAFPGQPMKCVGDSVSFYTHTGSHIDALAHWSRHGRVFSGIDADTNYTPCGVKQLGVDSIPPLIARGVLIDVARYMGVDCLEAGFPIGADELEGALRKQSVGLRDGDVVLFRTGWSRHWNDPAAYMAACPGLVEEAAAWLADRGCIAIGADQWDVDVVPAVPGKELAVHALCLAERGVYLIENLWLEDLAAAAVTEFCFIALVPPVRGASGFPAQMVAVI